MCVVNLKVDSVCLPDSNHEERPEAEDSHCTVERANSSIRIQCCKVFKIEQGLLLINVILNSDVHITGCL